MTDISNSYYNLHCRRLHENIPAIRMQDLVIHEKSSGPSEKQYTSPHVSIAPRPARGITTPTIDLALLVLITLSGCHFAREDT